MRQVFLLAVLAYAAQSASLKAKIASFDQLDTALAQEIEKQFAQLESADKTLHAQVFNDYEKVMAQVQQGKGATLVDAGIQELENHLTRPPYFVQALEMLDVLKESVWKQISQRDQANAALQNDLEEQRQHCDTAIGEAQQQLAENRASCDKARDALSAEIEQVGADCKQQLQDASDSERAIKEQCRADEEQLHGELEAMQELLNKSAPECPKCPRGQGIVNKENCECGECVSWKRIDGYRDPWSYIYKIDWAIGAEDQIQNKEESVAACQAMCLMTDGCTEVINEQVPGEQVRCGIMGNDLNVSNFADTGYWETYMPIFVPECAVELQ